MKLSCGVSQANFNCPPKIDELSNGVSQANSMTPPNYLKLSLRASFGKTVFCGPAMTALDSLGQSWNCFGTTLD